MNVKKLLLSVMGMICGLLVYAQSSDPSMGDDVNDVPLDGGLSYLLAAGVAYGAAKYRKARKTK